MRCPRCGKDYPSEYYFKTPSLCLACYDTLTADEKKSADEEAARLQQQRGRRPHQRSFLALILLSVITLGIYYYYWVYINLAELGTISPADDLQRPVRHGKNFFVLYLVLLAVAIFTATSMAIQFSVISQYFGAIPRIPAMPLVIWVLLAVQVGIEALLYYFFSLTIVRALAITGVREEPVGKLYVWIAVVIGLDIALSLAAPAPDARSLHDMRLGVLVPLSLLNTGFLLVYLYRCQAAINQIWGKAPGPAGA
jgi:hypothetical protein